jgi:succinate dehydrogenase / fumarate reductase membrane anchor subunit
MRDIWMDYLRGTAIRLICETLTIIWLVGCAGYALQILWSV